MSVETIRADMSAWSPETMTARESATEPVPATGDHSESDLAMPARRAVRAAAEHINRLLAESGRDLEFDLDEATGRTVVRVVSTHTGEVVRQIPPDEALRIAARLQEGESLRSLGVDHWW